MITGIYIAIFALDILVIYYVFIKEDVYPKKSKVKVLDNQKKSDTSSFLNSVNFCPKCGTNQKGNNFCTNCGANFLYPPCEHPY